ncbi:hypothetical protein VFPPC_14451 [Pochonia chlamydosporia 170]|uniref:Uncharacterized protein n=1 Tax=Pochonia chlamydosporia 170 TaxID=1380566 RepID=A0A179FNK8_METCM|nr:hypothetical protein VFPPC_14451 [Pochonia chlamydosporia 170]OAQ67206.1 hypothetical protein VFPPC_14451 [Pochonia chlamydosporia 170]
MPAATVLVALLAAFAVAQGSPGKYKTYFRSLETDPPKSLKVDAVRKTFDPPNVNLSVAVHKLNGNTKDKLPAKVPTMQLDFVPTIRDCLDPSDRPIVEDCESVCENLSEQQGPLVIQPLQIWHLEAGHCVFGAANLDPCSAIDIDPISTLAGYCNSMLTSCVRDGYDGYLEGAPPPMAFALSGTAAAPPYHEGPCQ